MQVACTCNTAQRGPEPPSAECMQLRGECELPGKVMGLWAFPLPAACDAGDDHGRAGDSSRDSGLRLKGQGLRSKVKRFKPQSF